jgi:hypothetical protein
VAASAHPNRICIENFIFNAQLNHAHDLPWGVVHGVHRRATPTAGAAGEAQLRILAAGRDDLVDEVCIAVFELYNFGLQDITRFNIIFQVVV